jgi:hypothetical protein
MNDNIENLLRDAQHALRAHHQAGVAEGSAYTDEKLSTDTVDVIQRLQSVRSHLAALHRDPMPANAWPGYRLVPMTLTGAEVEALQNRAAAMLDKPRSALSQGDRHTASVELLAAVASYTIRPDDSWARLLQNHIELHLSSPRAHPAHTLRAAIEAVQMHCARREALAVEPVMDNLRVAVARAWKADARLTKLGSQIRAAGYDIDSDDNLVARRPPVTMGAVGDGGVMLCAGEPELNQRGGSGNADPAQR